MLIEKCRLVEFTEGEFQVSDYPIERFATAMADKGHAFTGSVKNPKHEVRGTVRSHVERWHVALRERGSLSGAVSMTHEDHCQQYCRRKDPPICDCGPRGDGQKRKYTVGTTSVIRRASLKSCPMFHTHPRCSRRHGCMMWWKIRTSVSSLSTEGSATRVHALSRI